MFIQLTHRVCVLYRTLSYYLSVFDELFNSLELLLEIEDDQFC